MVGVDTNVLVRYITRQIAQGLSAFYPALKTPNLINSS